MVVEGKRPTPSKDVPRPSPTPNVNKIASLKKFPDRDYALDLLHQITKAVAPIIHKYKFRVGTLCEMFPKNPNLLGLNVNRGQKILIRLRAAHNDRSFLPISDLIGTLLHELAHNVHGPHDAKFYALLDELKTTYETSAYSNADYICEENKLGKGYSPPWAITQSIRQKRLQALSQGTYKSESRRLGGKAPPIRDLKKLMLQAAERRLQDSKWCADAASVEVINDSSADHLHAEAPNTIDKDGIREVIDLTTDQMDDDEIEIITVDACESSADSKRKTSNLAETLQGLINPRNDVPVEATQFFVSCSSGKSFIEESWQRKVVVNLDFEQLINQELERCMRTQSPDLIDSSSVLTKSLISSDVGKKSKGGSARSGESLSPRSSVKSCKTNKKDQKTKGRAKKKRQVKSVSPSKPRDKRVKTVRCITFEDLFAD